MQYTTRELNLLTTSLESQHSKSNKSFISEFYLIVYLCLNFFFKPVVLALFILVCFIDLRRNITLKRMLILLKY